VSLLKIIIVQEDYLDGCFAGASSGRLFAARMEPVGTFCRFKSKICVSSMGPKFVLKNLLFDITQLLLTIELCYAPRMLYQQEDSSRRVHSVQLTITNVYRYDSVAINPMKAKLLKWYRYSEPGD
jgi:hypothetical protein